MSKRMYHPCHKLSVPSAKIFWCRHCMQMFEDAISRWKHSKICRHNSSVCKDQDGQVIQMYVKPDTVSYTENILPGQKLVHKPQIKKKSADLKCVICNTKFFSLHDMREHVKYPCQKSYNRVEADSSDSDSDIKEDQLNFKIRRVENENTDSSVNTSTALSVLAEASKHVESLSHGYSVVRQTAGDGVQREEQCLQTVPVAEDYVEIAPLYTTYAPQGGILYTTEEPPTRPPPRADLEPVHIVIQSEDGKDLPEVSLDEELIQHYLKEALPSFQVGQLLSVQVKYKTLKYFTVGPRGTLFPTNQDLVPVKDSKDLEQAWQGASSTQTQTVSEASTFTDPTAESSLLLALALEQNHTGTLQNSHSFIKEEPVQPEPSTIYQQGQDCLEKSSEVANTSITGEVVNSYNKREVVNSSNRVEIDSSHTGEAVNSSISGEAVNSFITGLVVNNSSALQKSFDSKLSTPSEPTTSASQQLGPYLTTSAEAEKTTDILSLSVKQALLNHINKSFITETEHSYQLPYPEKPQLKTEGQPSRVDQGSQVELESVQRNENLIVFDVQNSVSHVQQGVTEGNTGSPELSNPAVEKQVALPHTNQSGTDSVGVTVPVVYIDKPSTEVAQSGEIVNNIVYTYAPCDNVYNMESHEQQHLTSSLDWFGFAELTGDNEVSSIPSAEELTSKVIKSVSYGNQITTHRRDENEITVPIFSEKSGVTKYKVLARQKAEEDIPQTFEKSVCEKGVNFNVTEKGKNTSKLVRVNVNATVNSQSKKHQNEKANKSLTKKNASKNTGNSQVNFGKGSKTSRNGKVIPDTSMSQKASSQMVSAVPGENKFSSKIEIEKQSNCNTESDKKKTCSKVVIEQKTNEDNEKSCSVGDSKKEIECVVEESLKTGKETTKVTVINKRDHHTRKADQSSSSCKDHLVGDNVENDKQSSKTELVLHNLEKVEMNSSVIESPPRHCVAGFTSNDVKTGECCQLGSEDELNKMSLSLSSDTEQELTVTDMSEVEQNENIEIYEQKHGLLPVSKCSVSLRRDPSIDNLHKKLTENSDSGTKSTALKRKLQTISRQSSDSGSSICDLPYQVPIKRKKSSDEKPKVDMVYNVDIDVRKSGRLLSAKCASRYRGDYGIRAETYSKISAKKNTFTEKDRNSSVIDNEHGDSVDGLVTMETDSVYMDIVQIANPVKTELGNACIGHNSTRNRDNEVTKPTEMTDASDQTNKVQNDFYSDTETSVEDFSSLNSTADHFTENDVTEVKSKLDDVSDNSLYLSCGTSDGFTSPSSNEVVHSCSIKDSSGILENDSHVPLQVSNIKCNHSGCDCNNQPDMCPNTQSTDIFMNSPEEFHSDSNTHNSSLELQEGQTVGRITISSKTGYVHSVGKSVNKRQRYIKKRLMQTEIELEPSSYVLSPDSSPDKSDPTQVLEKLRNRMFEKVGLSAHMNDKPKTFESKLITSKLKKSKLNSENNVSEQIENVYTDDDSTHDSRKPSPLCSCPCSNSSNSGSILDEVAKSLDSIHKARCKVKEKSFKQKRKRQRFEDKKFMLRSMSRIGDNSNNNHSESSGIISNRTVIEITETSCEPENNFLESEKKLSDNVKNSHVELETVCVKEHNKLGMSVTDCNLDSISEKKREKGSDKTEMKKVTEHKEVTVTKKKPKPVKCPSCCQTFRSKELRRKHYPCHVRQTRTWSQNKLRPNRAFRNDSLPRKRHAGFNSKISKPNKSNNKPRPQLLTPRKTKFRRVKGKRRRRLHQLIHELMSKRRILDWPHLNVDFTELSFKEQSFYRLGLFCVGNKSNGLDNYSGEDIALFQEHQAKEKEFYLSRNFKHIFPSSDDDSMDSNSDSKHSEPVAEVCDRTHVPVITNVHDLNGSFTDVFSPHGSSSSEVDVCKNKDSSNIHRFEDRSEESRSKESVVEDTCVKYKLQQNLPQLSMDTQKAVNETMEFILQNICNQMSKIKDKSMNFCGDECDEEGKSIQITSTLHQCTESVAKNCAIEDSQDTVGNLENLPEHYHTILERQVTEVGLQNSTANENHLNTTDSTLNDMIASDNYIDFAMCGVDNIPISFTEVTISSDNSGEIQHHVPVIGSSELTDLSPNSYSAGSTDIHSKQYNKSVIECYNPKSLMELSEAVCSCHGVSNGKGHTAWRADSEKHPPANCISHAGSPKMKSPSYRISSVTKFSTDTANCGTAADENEVNSVPDVNEETNYFDTKDKDELKISRKINSIQQNAFNCKLGTDICENDNVPNELNTQVTENEMNCSAEIVTNASVKKSPLEFGFLNHGKSSNIDFPVAQFDKNKTRHKDDSVESLQLLDNSGLVNGSISLSKEDAFKKTEEMKNDSENNFFLKYSSYKDDSDLMKITESDFNDYNTPSLSKEKLLEKVVKPNMDKNEESETLKTSSVQSGKKSEKNSTSSDVFIQGDNVTGNVDSVIERNKLHHQQPSENKDSHKYDNDNIDNSLLSYKLSPSDCQDDRISNAKMLMNVSTKTVQETNSDCDDVQSVLAKKVHAENNSFPLCKLNDLKSKSEPYTHENLIEEMCSVGPPYCSSPKGKISSPEAATVIRYRINGVYISENLETGVKEIISDEFCETDLHLDSSHGSCSDISRDQYKFNSTIDSFSFSIDQEKNYKLKDIGVNSDMPSKIDQYPKEEMDPVDADSKPSKESRSNTVDLDSTLLVTNKEPKVSLPLSEIKNGNDNIEEVAAETDRKDITDDNVLTDSENSVNLTRSYPDEIEVVRHSDDIHTFKKDVELEVISVCDDLEPDNENESYLTVRTGPFKALEKDIDISFISETEAPPVLEKEMGDIVEVIEVERNEEESQDSDNGPPVLEPVKKPRNERHFLDVLGEMCEKKNVEEKIGQSISDKYRYKDEISHFTESVTQDDHENYPVEDIPIKEDIGRHFSDVIDSSHHEPQPFSEMHLLLDRSERGEVTLAQIRSLLQTESKKGTEIPKDRLLKIRSGVEQMISKVKLPQKKDPAWLKRGALLDYSYKDGADLRSENVFSRESSISDDSQLPCENETTFERKNELELGTRTKIDPDTTTGSITDNILQMLTSLDDKGSIADNMTNLLDILAENLGFQRSSTENRVCDTDKVNEVTDRSENRHLSDTEDHIDNESLDEEPPLLDDIPIADDFNVDEELLPESILIASKIFTDNDFSQSPVAKSSSKNLSKLDESRHMDDVETCSSIDTMPVECKSEEKVDQLDQHYLKNEDANTEIFLSNSTSSVLNQNSSKAQTIFKSITELNSIETDDESGSEETFDAIAVSKRMSELKSLSKHAESSDVESEILSDDECLDEKMHSENTTKESVTERCSLKMLEGMTEDKNLSQILQNTSDCRINNEEMNRHLGGERYQSSKDTCDEMETAIRDTETISRELGIHSLESEIRPPKDSFIGDDFDNNKNMYGEHFEKGHKTTDVGNSLMSREEIIVDNTVKLPSPEPLPIEDSATEKDTSKEGTELTIYDAENRQLLIADALLSDAQSHDISDANCLDMEESNLNAKKKLTEKNTSCTEENKKRKFVEKENMDTECALSHAETEICEKESWTEKPNKTNVESYELHDEIVARDVEINADICSVASAKSSTVSPLNHFKENLQEGEDFQSATKFIQHQPLNEEEGALSKILNTQAMKESSVENKEMTDSDLNTDVTDQEGLPGNGFQTGLLNGSHSENLRQSSNGMDDKEIETSLLTNDLVNTENESVDDDNSFNDSSLKEQNEVILEFQDEPVLSTLNSAVCTDEHTSYLDNTTDAKKENLVNDDLVKGDTNDQEKVKDVLAQEPHFQPDEMKEPAEGIISGSESEIVKYRSTRLSSFPGVDDDTEMDNFTLLEECLSTHSDNMETDFETKAIDEIGSIAVIGNASGVPESINEDSQSETCRQSKNETGSSEAESSFESECHFNKSHIEADSTSVAKTNGSHNINMRVCKDANHDEYDNIADQKDIPAGRNEEFRIESKSSSVESNTLSKDTAFFSMENLQEVIQSSPSNLGHGSPELHSLENEQTFECESSLQVNHDADCDSLFMTEDLRYKRETDEAVVQTEKETKSVEKCNSNLKEGEESSINDETSLVEIVEENVKDVEIVHFGKSVISGDQKNVSELDENVVLKPHINESPVLVCGNEEETRGTLEHGGDSSSHETKKGSSVNFENESANDHFVAESSLYANRADVEIETAEINQSKEIDLNEVDLLNKEGCKSSETDVIDDLSDMQNGIAEETSRTDMDFEDTNKSSINNASSVNFEDTLSDKNEISTCDDTFDSEEHDKTNDLSNNAVENSNIVSVDNLMKQSIGSDNDQGDASMEKNNTGQQFIGEHGETCLDVNDDSNHTVLYDTEENTTIETDFKHATNGEDLSLIQVNSSYLLEEFCESIAEKVKRKQKERLIKLDQARSKYRSLHVTPQYPKEKQKEFSVFRSTMLQTKAERDSKKNLAFEDNDKFNSKWERSTSVSKDMFITPCSVVVEPMEDKVTKNKLSLKPCSVMLTRLDDRTLEKYRRTSINEENRPPIRFKISLKNLCVKPCSPRPATYLSDAASGNSSAEESSETEYSDELSGRNSIRSTESDTWTQSNDCKIYEIKNSPRAFQRSLEEGLPIKIRVKSVQVERNEVQTATTEDGQRSLFSAFHDVILKKLPSPFSEVQENNNEDAEKNIQKPNWVKDLNLSESDSSDMESENEDNTKLNIGNDCQGTEDNSIVVEMTVAEENVNESTQVVSPDTEMLDKESDIIAQYENLSTYKEKCCKNNNHVESIKNSDCCFNETEQNFEPNHNSNTNSVAVNVEKETNFVVELNSQTDSSILKDDLNKKESVENEDNMEITDVGENISEEGQDVIESELNEEQIENVSVPITDENHDECITTKELIDSSPVSDHVEITDESKKIDVLSSENKNDKQSLLLQEGDVTYNVKTSPNEVNECLCSANYDQQSENPNISALIGLESETFIDRTESNNSESEDLLYYAVELNEDFETSQAISSLEQMEIEKINLEPEQVSVLNLEETETNIVESLTVEDFEVSDDMYENVVEISDANQILGHEEIVPVNEVEACTSEMTDSSCLAVTEKRDKFLYGINEDSQSSQEFVEECVMECAEEVEIEPEIVE